MGFQAQSCPRSIRGPDRIKTPIVLVPGFEIRLPGGSVVKNLSASAGDPGDMGSIPGSRRSPVVGNGNPLQYSCLENSIHRGAWRAAVHGVTKSRT